MSLQEIQAAIARLPAKEVTELMTWLAEYDADLWDQQIEEDLKAGRLQPLLEEVDKDWHAR